MQGTDRQTDVAGLVFASESWDFLSPVSYDCSELS